MSSQLEREMDGDQVPQSPQRFRHSPKPCPRYCPIFVCIVGDGCKEECRNLEMVKGSICDLCENDGTCSKKRKMALLDLEYFKEVKKRQSDESVTRIEELKSQHRHFELSYKNLKEQAIGLNLFSFAKKTSIQEQGYFYRNKLEVYREVMDILDISYKIDVKLDDLHENEGIGIKNWLYLIGICGLVLLYVWSKFV